MRLSKIRLEGFKSFVDHTVLSFPSNRVGVVGPNGCGKSNVIDAVRWVMGESSAKHLRGGAMTDVIFNGSGNRKPAEKASIELVFSEVDLAQYPEHDEIAVKREIGRNGQSTYFLNNVKCRRKDITDLFLGTGLGPRSYAIIEQGMISRLIEAKPEDLRVFFEEAAGISKYKERRKETAQRMKETRDNLDKLNEVRHELDNQLERLQKQAKKAEKYKELKASEHLLKAQLQALRWNTLDITVQESQTSIEEQATKLEEDLLNLHTLETNHKQQNEARLAAQDTLNDAQEKHYTVESEVQRLNQAIEHANERYEQTQWDFEQLETEWENAKENLAEDQAQIENLTFNLEETENEFAAAKTHEEESQYILQEAEAQLQDWQITWDDFNQRAAEPTQRSQVERTKLQNLEQRLEQSQQRLLKLENEARGINVQTLETEVSQLDEELAQVKIQLEDSESILQTHQEAVVQLRDKTHELASQLHDNRSKINQMSGRLSSLEALQEAALGKNSADLGAWLHAHGLKESTQLAQHITVEKGWEKAVEIVLNDILQALCVTDITAFKNALNNPPQGNLILFATDNTLNVSNQQTNENLATKVKTTLPLDNLLSSVHIAEDLEQAYQLRDQLAAHESVITKQGLWLSQHWLKSQQGTDEKAGVLAREQEIQKIAAQLERLDKTVVNLSQELEQQREALQEHENSRDQAQHTVNALRHQFGEIQAQHSSKLTRLEHLQAHLQRLDDEQNELQEQIAQDIQDSEITRENLHQALMEMEELAEERESLNQKRQTYQETVMQAHHAWQTAKDERHQVEIHLQTLRTDKSRLEKGSVRLQERVEQLEEQRYELQQTLEQQADPMMELQTELENYQQQQVDVEEALMQAKQTVAHLEISLSDYEATRSELENRSNELRTNLEKMRMTCQADEVRRQTIEEQLTEQDFSPVTLLSELPEYADEESWQSQIEAAERKLQRLGTVNMAALEEFKEQSERKQFFDTQAEDLLKALQLLEDAIKTIDRETRLRFKQTLDTVNTHLQDMFPRLFRGGQAYLDLTDDDLLKAGVKIMARPPGKKNSTIHLLSGGEKALTAIALVFSIFELNPAPFCMLDEVDAPLDDTNVERFSALVNAMSERVQFIFISHNKITMEIANQLIGVTMQEAGVSRHVPVDIEQAVNMVNG